MREGVSELCKNDKQFLKDCIQFRQLHTVPASKTWLTAKSNVSIPVRLSKSGGATRNNIDANRTPRNLYCAWWSSRKVMIGGMYKCHNLSTDRDYGEVSELQHVRIPHLHLYVIGTKTEHSTGKVASSIPAPLSSLGDLEGHRQVGGACVRSRG